jgi:hypothetical protein
MVNSFWRTWVVILSIAHRIGRRQPPRFIPIGAKLSAISFRLSLVVYWQEGVVSTVFEHLR